MLPTPPSTSKPSPLSSSTSSTVMLLSDQLSITAHHPLQLSKYSQRMHFFSIRVLSFFSVKFPPNPYFSLSPTVEIPHPLGYLTNFFRSDYQTKPTLNSTNESWLHHYHYRMLTSFPAIQLNKVLTTHWGRNATMIARDKVEPFLQTLLFDKQALSRHFAVTCSN